LNSSGIHPREAKALAALSAELPEEWLLYASLQYLPPRENPMDIDALIVMDDRVLLLEVKDWNGVLTNNDKPSIALLPFQNLSGDPEQEYFVNKRPRVTPPLLG
jgi:hypothetical protein